MKPWVIVRRTSQIIFLLLFVYILWSTTYPLTGNLPTEAFFKIDPFIVMITSISERLILPGMAFCIIMCVLTVILGRFFCGWICPMGTVIDGMGSFRKSKAYHGFNTPTRGMRFIKFALLGCTALCAFFGIQIAWIFDPLVITARFVSINFIPVVTSSIDSVFIFLSVIFSSTGLCTTSTVHSNRPSWE